MVAMRGDDHPPRAIFSYVSAEERVPQDHPLRAIRTFVDEILREMTREFDALYAQHGRPSIPPERLLRAQLLQLFYSIRSERLLMEQLDYNILFRWFVGLEMDEPVWVPTVFTKNRDRLLLHAVAHSFFQRVVARASDLMSDEHFTVDGTLLEAWASQKSFQRKDGDTDGDGRNFREQERKNDTHASTTDPDARLYRKSNNAEARLAYLGHVLMENRHGLILDAHATVADGFAEREAATTMLSTHWRFAPPRHRTVGADKAYDTVDFVEQVRAIDMTPHVAPERHPMRWERDRCPHDAPHGLHDESACATAHRARVCLAQDDCGLAQGEAARPRDGGCALRLRQRRVQHQTDRHTARGGRMRRNAWYADHDSLPSRAMNGRLTSCFRELCPYTRQRSSA
jgi:transposase